MLYYSFLKQEQRSSELWFRGNNGLWPIFDYKIDGDKIRLISDSNMSIPEAVTLDELINYIETEGNPGQLAYTIVDEQTGLNLDIKDRFENKTIFEICS